MRLTTRGRRLRTTVVAVTSLAALGAGVVLSVRALDGPLVVQERCTATSGGQEYSLAPDQAANAALITAVSVRRGLPARAASIAIAAAIQESKLRVVDYGDRDSLGLFQQRPSQGWGTAEQVMDPVYATNAFFDVLVEIEGFEALEITDAAQRVQRSAFPQAYGDHEPQGRAFASALAGYSPAALTCRLRPPGDLPAQAPDETGLTPRAQEVLAAARVAFGDAVRAGPVAHGPDGPDGTVLVLSPGDGEPGPRLAWSLAAWAVATADDLQVTGVAVDGRRWRRDAPGQGWGPAPGAGPGGQVVIEVAEGR